MKWFTVVCFGSCTVPRGPWKSEDDAFDAINRWCAYIGQDADTLLAATNARLVVCDTRAKARAADISTAKNIIAHL